MRSSNPGATVRLCLFPCAGGSASSYQEWTADVPSFLDTFAIQLPGRANRFLEEPLKTLAPICEALCDELEQFATMPVAFFGHSLGALIAFEVCRELRRRRQRLPIHLFVAGRAAPQVMARTRPIRDLPDAEFLVELNRMGGIPPEIQENTELMELLTPILKADITLHETYSLAPETRLACPITAFGGVSDADVTLDDVRGWQEQTEAGFFFREFEGGHFFVNAERKKLIQIIAARLTGVGRAGC
ncbi:thioesterase II family protein [Granulicella sp. S190]|uniref:thioesterase II family protein n=1 Tax=Granulicella sp. S190 TaxID=1747226 RepID=UPI00131D2E3F|nr:thioesterase domain-containing protein [Granulicella sp. S190]